MADNNPNALMKAKQENTAAVQELITKDEYKAKRLAEIKVEIQRLHNAKEEAVSQVEDRQAELIEEALDLFEHNNGRFQVWWENWSMGLAETSGAFSDKPPFSAVNAWRIKQLHDFCTKDFRMVPLGQPRVPNGFERTALYELTAPKYIKDERGEAEHSQETVKRKEVRENVYGRLKKRINDRIAYAKKTGTEPKLITKLEVQEELTKQFAAAGMVVEHKTVKGKSLAKFLDAMERAIYGTYSSWEGNKESQAAILDKIEEQLEICRAEFEEEYGS